MFNLLFLRYALFFPLLASLLALHSTLLLVLYAELLYFDSPGFGFFAHRAFFYFLFVRKEVAFLECDLGQ
jgi:hypothetical protein